MKLQQVRFLAAVVESGLNLTVAAATLHTTQPAISKQLKQLEEELGFELFVRSGRAFTKLTPAGQRVVGCALRIVQETRNIKLMSEEYRNKDRGTLSIGTTHTQARYVLPHVIKRFREAYPGVRFQLHEGTSEQIAELARLGRLDLAIATGSRERFDTYVLLPCYHWRHAIVVPRHHPLAHERKPKLADVLAYPLVTYGFALPDLFGGGDVMAHIVLTAQDADVIKTYVRLGLGIGIVASVALERKDRDDLVAIEAAHLFEPQTTWIGFARSGLLRGFMYEFIKLFAPHLTRRMIERGAHSPTQAEVDSQFHGTRLPSHNELYSPV